MSSSANKEKPEIGEEGDEPLFIDKAPIDKENSSNGLIPSHKVRDIEEQIKAAKSYHNILLQDKGFHLLIFCIILVACIYAADCFLINNGMQSSTLMKSFFELLKFIISILIGFVFAKVAVNEPGD